MLFPPQIKTFTKSITFLIVLFAASSVSTLAWGDKGHRIVARIAWVNLTPAARAQAADLLATDSFFSVCQKQHVPTATPADKFVCIAIWADKVRSERPETAEWHFVDIPRDAPNYKASRDCKNGDCVIEEIERAFSVLSASQNKSARAEALKFLVHFVGDMHQPLHDATDTHDKEAIASGFETDRGGNLKFVTWLGDAENPFNDNWKLHAVWDTGILEATAPNELDATKSLLKLITPEEKAFCKPEPVGSNWPKSLAGLLIQWAQDGHSLAVSNAYNIGPQDSNDVATDDKGHKFHRYHLEQNYLKANQPVVGRQLRLAGVRLARILNEAMR